MFTFWRCFIDWLSSFFWNEEMEITLVGLNNSGKTSFLNVISNGSYAEDMAPTIGFNFRKITKGGVTIKMWDIGGQARYRHMWLRYCRSVDVIVFMVDSADEGMLLKAKIELETLVADRYLVGIPVIVLGNKSDLRGALDEREIIETMDLCSIQDRELCCYSISCKDQENINLALQWIVQHRKVKQ